MATLKKDSLEKIPGFSQGVRANSAVRMIDLMRPICPNSKMKMVKDSDGKWVPAEFQPQNCQLAGGEWWKMCEEQGHDPYFTNRVWYEHQDVVEIDDEGNELVTGTKRIKHVARRPNIAQVSASIRHNSGRGVINAIERKGFRRLGDFGYEEVCQFRNCQAPITPEGNGGQYGQYCSKEHLQLIAADANSVMLHTPNERFLGADYEKAVRARRKQLREAASDV